MFRARCRKIGRLGLAGAMAFFAVWAIPAAQSRPYGKVRVYKYETPGVRLDGRLIERTVYGPPGYGETPAKDERDKILVLRLTHPITVEPLLNAKANRSLSLDTVKDISDIQLFIKSSQTAEAHKLVGAMVMVVGTLNEAVAPSQYTKVWLDAQVLRPK